MLYTWRPAVGFKTVDIHPIFWIARRAMISETFLALYPDATASPFSGQSAENGDQGAAPLMMAFIGDAINIHSSCRRALNTRRTQIG
jgi:hypothetical protein